MSTQIQRRRGTTAEHSTFTGAAGELTIDTTKNTVIVHDGTTVGGFPLAKEGGVPSSIQDLDNVTITSIASGEVLKWDGAAWVNNTPAEAGLLTSSDIGSSVQAYDATILTSSDIGSSVQAYDATILTSSDIDSTVQSYDANLPAWPASVDATEVGYLDGVTSNIQTQIDAKAGTGKAIAMAIVFG
jgi:hypothetical protein